LLAVIVKLVLLAAVLFFVGRALIQRLSAVSWAELKLDPWFVALAGISLLTAVAIVAVAYRTLLNSVCRAPSYPTMCAVSWIPPLGKYIPGKAASVAGIVWMLQKRGVPMSVALGHVFVIQGLSVVLGLTLAAPLTVWHPVYQQLPIGWLVCCLLVAAGIVCLHPKVISALTNFFLVKIRREPLKVLPRIRSYLPPMAIMLANRVLAGAALWLLARSVSDVPLALAGFFLSASALAGTVGFLAVFAPAGLGVSEGILLIVLGPVIGGGAAALVAVAFRLMQTLVDIVLAAAGLIILRSSPEREAADY
jgi:uncharacterized membrane protein YbhN (UPF0104 family)